MKVKKSPGDITFTVCNTALMILLSITTLYPFLYLLSLSLTSGEVSLTQSYIIPPKVSFENYIKVLTNSDIGYGFKNTIMRTVIGTTISIIAVIFTAYPLSKRYLVHRNFFTGFIVLTMFVSGGTIPSYLLVKKLSLINTIWALVLPGAISAYNVIIMRNFFMSIPDSLEESAKIDGANDILILFKIIVPVSVPIITTVVLWLAVGHWNAWFDSLIYTTKPSRQVLQVVMRRIVLEGTQQMLNATNSNVDENQIVNPETVKAATVMVTTIPIIIFYPFLQKYFVKGVMVGSIKG